MRTGLKTVGFQEKNKDRKNKNSLSPKKRKLVDGEISTSDENNTKAKIEGEFNLNKIINGKVEGSKRNINKNSVNVNKKLRVLISKSRDSCTTKKKKIYL